MRIAEMRNVNTKTHPIQPNPTTYRIPQSAERIEHSEQGVKTFSKTISTYYYVQFTTFTVSYYHIVSGDL